MGNCVTKTQKELKYEPNTQKSEANDGPSKLSNMETTSKSEKAPNTGPNRSKSNPKIINQANVSNYNGSNHVAIEETKQDALVIKIDTGNKVKMETVCNSKYQSYHIQKSDESNAKSNNKIEELNAKLKMELDNSCKQQNKINELTQKNDKLNKTIEELNAKLEVAFDNKCEQQNKTDELTQKNEQLNLLIIDLKQALSVKEKENKQLKTSKKRLSNCNTSLTNQIEDLKKKSRKKPKNEFINETENKEIMNDINGGKIGLTNIGNTCWMNSIIQSISHVPHFVDYFRKNEMNGNVCNSVKMIIDNIWNNNQELMYKSLQKFKSTMSKMSSTYCTTNEQDPAEFLDRLMSKLHSELNVASCEYANKDLIVGNGMPDSMVSLLSWTAYLKSNDSPIIDLFYGQHKSNIICANKGCKYDYVLFEPFKMLSVSTNLNGKNSLYDCIDQYVAQNMVKNSKWYCSKCKQQLPNSIEQIQLYKFPKVLIIQLKKQKMQNVSDQPFIAYPVNNLDLTKYDISGTNKKQIYDLFAVSCLSGHHCIAFAKNYTSNEWFCFNDSNVRKVKSKKVVVQNAYLLFYQRKD